MAADLNHNWGQDLAVSATGDLATVTGTIFGQQRVIKRLMTNPGDYLFHPGYGAGLPRFVGTVVNTNQLTAVIVAQMFLEDAVAQTPLPSVSVTSGSNGSVFANIQYADSTTGQTSIISAPLPETGS